MNLSAKHLTKILVSLMAAIILPVHAVEKEIVLGFDGLSEFSLDVGDFGVSFSGAAVLTCGSSLNCGAFPPFSGDNVLFDNFNSGGIITATFDTPTSGKISKVTARVTGNTNITMIAYDDQGSVLDSDEVGGANYVGSNTGISANKLLTVESESSQIKSVVFLDSGNTFTIDNFAFVGQPRKVVIDPGHGKIGGQYQRAPSTNLGIIEDQLTLQIGNSLDSFLNSEGINSTLTRSTENAPFAPPDCNLTNGCGIDLQKRVRFAEMQEPDILISIHTNGGPATANGTETYHYPKAPSNSAMSLSLAEKIHEEFVFLGLRDRGVKIPPDGFAMLRTKIVSVLTEVAFHSNTQLASGQIVTDEEQLNDNIFRNNAAESIGTGIINYFEEIEAQQ